MRALLSRPLRLTGALCLTAASLLSTQAWAKEGPAQLKWSNQCEQEIELRLDEHAVTLAAGAQEQSGEAAAPEKGAWTLKLASGATLGLVAGQAGGEYRITLSACGPAGAHVQVDDLAPRPEGLSPQAAAQLRFRAQQNTHLEYRLGPKGRFKPLSVAMTTYAELPAGEHVAEFRLKAARQGPIIKTVKRTVKVEPGHNYLLEANVVDKELFFKQEDEGFIKPGK